MCLGIRVPLQPVQMQQQCLYCPKSCHLSAHQYVSSLLPWRNWGSCPNHLLYTLSIPGVLLPRLQQARLRKPGASGVPLRPLPGPCVRLKLSLATRYASVSSLQPWISFWVLFAQVVYAWCPLTGSLCTALNRLSASEQQQLPQTCRCVCWPPCRIPLQGNQSM